MQTQDVTKFEFILTLEKNIVIQRFFSVPHFNPKSRNSVDLYECVKNICAEISQDLKLKTLDFMNSNPNLFLDQTRTEEKEEYFLLKIKLGDQVFISRIFPAHIYHPKVRYAVDIRPKVKKILGDLTEVLSTKELVTKYLEYELK